MHAKDYWQNVVKPFQTFDLDAKKERASRIQLSAEVMVTGNYLLQLFAKSVVAVCVPRAPSRLEPPPTRRTPKP